MAKVTKLAGRGIVPFRGIFPLGWTILRCCTCGFFLASAKEFRAISLLEVDVFIPDFLVDDCGK